MRRVLVHVNRLVLKGIRHEDRLSLVEGLRRELRLQLAEPGLANNLQRETHVPRLDGGRIRLGSTAGPASIGTQAGRRITKVITS
jgi:hypothetical protein